MPSNAARALSLSCLLTCLLVLPACKREAPPAEAAPATPAPEATATPAPAQAETPPAAAPAPAADFDPASVPESTATLPPFPFFAIPDGMESTFDDKDKLVNFDRQFFIAGSKAVPVEGKIFHDRFTGNVDQINGLNHYIGMSTIHNEMFPEFAIMRYVIGLLVGWGVLAALIGKRWALASWLFGLLAFVIWAMWDMYSWGWNYGHKLDPHAAIKIEGMAYQPPLFGHKKLLNFDAWSYPDIGGWILFGSITLAVLVFLYEWKRPLKATT